MKRCLNKVKVVEPCDSIICEIPVLTVLAGYVCLTAVKIEISRFHCLSTVLFSFLNKQIRWRNGKFLQVKTFVHIIYKLLGF